MWWQSMRKYSRIGLDEVEYEQHAHWIALAEDGCISAAKALMGDAATCLQHGLPLPEPLGSYIGEALYKAATVSVRGGIRG